MTITATDASRILQRYAKEYAAGAFATPTKAELEHMDVRTYGAGDKLTVVVGKILTQTSMRTDWTGEPFSLPRGSYVATHIGRAPKGPVPTLDAYDYVMAYPEDKALAPLLSRRPRTAVRITASSEIIACYGPVGTAERHYSPVDMATAVEVPVPPFGLLADDALDELDGLKGWDDDYPFYSDGSWSALSLRGFNPDDPAWGVKPAEMPRKWQEEHADAMERKCDWTRLADGCPALVNIVRAVFGDAQFERVRLMKMASRGQKGAVLRRHSDVTDKAAGTRDGLIMRFHLPLVTSPEVKMTTWELDGTSTARHLKAWHLYYLDQRKPHSVINPSKVDRVHLVVDVLADDATRKMVAA